MAGSWHAGLASKFDRWHLWQQTWESPRFTQFQACTNENRNVQSRVSLLLRRMTRNSVSLWLTIVSLLWLSASIIYLGHCHRIPVGRSWPQDCRWIKFLDCKTRYKTSADWGGFPKSFDSGRCWYHLDQPAHCQWHSTRLERLQRHHSNCVGDPIEGAPLRSRTRLYHAACQHVPRWRVVSLFKGRDVN